MPEVNLQELSLSDLKQLQRDVTKAIATFETRQKAEARIKVEALARELGFSLGELLAADPRAAQRSTKSSSPAKYRDLEDPSLTWSGRGRKPKWFIDAVAAGQSPESLMIN